jgi:flagellar hook-length control protein FliK
MRIEESQKAQKGEKAHKNKASGSLAVEQSNGVVQAEFSRLVNDITEAFMVPLESRRELNISKEKAKLLGKPKNIEDIQVVNVKDGYASQQAEEHKLEITNNKRELEEDTSQEMLIDQNLVSQRNSVNDALSESALQSTKGIAWQSHGEKSENKNQVSEDRSGTQVAIADESENFPQGYHSENNNTKGLVKHHHENAQQNKGEAIVKDEKIKSLSEEAVLASNLEKSLAEGKVEDKGTTPIKGELANLVQNSSASITNNNKNLLNTNNLASHANTATNANLQLKSAIEHVLSKALDLKTISATPKSISQNNITNVSGAFAQSNAYATSNEDTKAGALLRSNLQSVIERVESALKEAARSKDGKRITLKLDPPELGNIKVDLSLREGNLHARLSADNGQLVTLLRERAADLQGMLRKLGIETERVTVSVSSSDNGTFVFGRDVGSDNSHHHTRREENKRDLNPLFDLSDKPLLSEALNQVVIDHWVA